MKTKIKIILAALAMLSVAPTAFAGVTVFDDGESKLKLSGLVRVDGGTATLSQTGKADADSQGLNLGRAYLTAKYTINSDWMMRITTDVKVESNSKLSKSSNIFLKYAYLQGKLAGDAAVLRLGVSHTPWVDDELALWKHAYLIDEPSSTFGYEASSDLGVGLKGKLADGMVNYWVAAVNGKGYTDIKKTNGMDYTGRIGIRPIKGLTLDVGYRSGYKGTKTSATTALGKQTLTRTMISYGDKSYRVGADYMLNQDKTVAAPFQDDLFSVWAWTKFDNHLGLVGRFDYETSDLDAATVANVQQKTTQYVLGVTYSPAKKVDFTLGYKYKKFTGLNYTANNESKNTVIGFWSQFAY